MGVAVKLAFSRIANRVRMSTRHPRSVGFRVRGSRIGGAIHQEIDELIRKSQTPDHAECPRSVPVPTVTHRETSRLRRHSERPIVGI